MAVKIFCFYLLMVKVNMASTEDETFYTSTYNLYSPSSVNFQDIYTSTINKLNEDDPTNEEDPISSISTQFAEFHPKEIKLELTTTESINANITNTTSETNRNLKEELKKEKEIEEDERIKVVPVKKHRKGVLDVLFPASRVKSFKSVFDSLKRLLSSTFR